MGMSGVDPNGGAAMSSLILRWVVAGAAAASLSVLPVTLAPSVAAAPCADPAMCQADPPVEQCEGAPEESVCTQPGDTEIRSEPNPADIPEVPQAETDPWEVMGIPGTG
jgi:hypothetical protein